jgi:3-oxoacyl-[acyl-carrier-protein] synthase II
MNAKPRVVVTGVGIISCIGNSYADVQESLRACRDGLGPVTLFSTSAQHPVGEVRTTARPEEGKLRTYLLADCAVREALADSGLPEKTPSHHMGISLSTCTSGMLEMEEAFLLLRKGKKCDISFVKALSMGILADDIASQYKITGLKMFFSTACSSSANAIACAFQAIRQKECEVMIAGGADSLSRLTYYGFQGLKVMAESKCAPFAIARQGLNLGEGGGILVLESLAHAQQRGAKIYAELIGVGMSADAYHMSAPDPIGKGAYKAMQAALACACISPEEIEYISAHGTGTLQNDEIETSAILQMFATCSDKPWVSSVKSYLGHTLGASGAIAAICAINSLETGFIPPTLRLSEVDPKCNLRHPPQHGIRQKISTVLVNAFGFGGNNASLVFREFHG